MRVNIENMLNNIARILTKDKTDNQSGGYAYMLQDELIGHLKELRDDPSKHGEFFALYRFNDRKDPTAQ